MNNSPKLFFASDFHLGYNDAESAREIRISAWVKSIPNNSELFLVGDIFDFWIEYNHIANNNYPIFLHALDEALAKDIKIYMFKGNHDMWLGNFFKKKGIILVDNELVVSRSGCNFYIHHGDGILKGDFNYNILKKILRNPITQYIAKKVNPNLLYKMAYKWSRQGHKKKQIPKNPPINKITDFTNAILKHTDIDYFIFGHYHYKKFINVNNKCKIILLGDCIKETSYAVFDNNKINVY